MQLTATSDSLSIRRNKKAKSLCVDYPRGERHDGVLAELLNQHQTKIKIVLPVVSSDREGIEIKLPSFLSGIFYIKIQDGDQSFLKRIAIQ